jgi:hypothetical protein
MSFISRLAPPMGINRLIISYLCKITLPVLGEGDFLYLAYFQMINLQT